MKKLFALLFTLGAMTSAFAQNGRNRNDSRDVILGNENNRSGNEDRRYDGDYNKNELDTRIARINREFDWKIESVKRDCYLRNGEKKRQIRALENERRERIREARDRNNDRNYRNGRRY